MLRRHTFLPEFHPYICWLKFGFSRSPTVEEKETLRKLGENYVSGALQGRDWYHLSHLLREIQSLLDFILDSTSNVTLRALDCGCETLLFILALMA